MSRSRVRADVMPMPLRVDAVHLKRSNHVATFSIEACAVRSTLIGDTDTNPSAIA